MTLRRLLPARAWPAKHGPGAAARATRLGAPPASAGALRALAIVVAVAAPLVLAGCGTPSSELCPSMLSEVRTRLVAQGIEPASELFRMQYASATRTCLQEPSAFFSLLTGSSEDGRMVRIQN